MRMNTVKCLPIYLEQVLPWSRQSTPAGTASCWVVIFCSNLAFKIPQSVRKDCQEAFFCVRKGGGTRADYECKQIRMERRHMFRQEMG